MNVELPTNHHLSGKTIVIAGAGIAGLSFAIALNKQWSSITTAEPPELILYERDLVEDVVGREGYSLSLRSDAPGGIQALQKLGVLDAMIEASIQDVNKKDGGFCIWNKKWEPIIKIRAQIPDGLPVGGLRLARRNLRKVLINATTEAGCTIHWGTQCIAVSSNTSSEFPVTVTLSNGGTIDCDMVIAADGASSKLRAQLRPNDKLQFQKIVLMGGTAVYPEGTSPPAPIDRDWGIMPLGDQNTALFFSPVGPNTALWSLSYRTETPITRVKQPVSEEVVERVLNEAKERVKGLPPLYNELLELTAKESIMLINANDKEAFGHDDASLPAEFAHGKVIFIGDSNHAVTPYAGNGANMALCDGWDLADQLLTAKNVEDGVKQFDKLVLPQRNAVLKQSHTAISIGHSQGWRLTLALMFLRIVQFLFFNNAFYYTQSLFRRFHQWRNPEKN